MSHEQTERGIAEFSARLSKCGINVLEHSRPFPNRYATCFEVGKPGRATDVVISDEFLRDLPNTKEYQTATDDYGLSVSGRIRCGSPNLFYCASHRPIEVSILWPLQSSAMNGMLSTWMLTVVIDQTQRTMARCCLDLNRQHAYFDRTVLDNVRNAVTRIRRAIDQGAVSFFDLQSHPETYQRIETNARKPDAPKTKQEIESFIAGKVFMFGFELPEAPGEVWAVDPWDAECLGISKKELSQAASVLRARGLIELDSTLSFARPSDRMLSSGWPAAENSSTVASAPKILGLATLPKKEELVADLKDAVTQHSELALIFVDLDRFKEVNDTRGHAAGDACLDRVITAIAGAVGRKGKLYRWGGDEFAIVLPDFSTQESGVTAERIRRAIEQAKAGEDIYVTASIGICATDWSPSVKAEELLEAADQAMYASKRGGKNRVTTWPDLEGLSERRTNFLNFRTLEKNVARFVIHLL